ncbi:hypothetical protein C1T17_07275 [Sphingobium sp. SCG-1]|uniref:UrcA family protein n=1 Tax=Sphingobium sp. SCG-1 TaxID=2072936 RepID=UPI000CD67F7E|nr:UrcA family protein [Sphingobium sp. SCG-1]AUW57933.1 hypothetical protein C1T17_07275 [Sphingobium sp. SCG-1]
MLTLRTLRRAALALALPATALLAAPALAQSDLVVTYGADNAVTKSLPVDISDLRLSSPKGRAVAEGRIAAAVKSVCSEKQIYSNEGKRDYRRCYADAKAQAFTQAGLTQTASR